MLDRDELQAINGLTAELREFRSSLQTNRGNSNAEIHVNAGGVGVWVATTACLVMLAVSFMLALLYLDVRDEQRYGNAQLQTIYVLVPDLKKMVDAEMAKKKER